MKRKIALFIVIVLAAGTLTACLSVGNRLIGVWVNQTSVLGIVTEKRYEFRDDNTGTRSLVMGIDQDFTYQTDGKTDILQITTKVLGKEVVEEYVYKVNMDELLLTNEKGETLVFDRK